MSYKLWVDDVREKPKGYDMHTDRVDSTIDCIHFYWNELSVVDLDHDAGAFRKFGGDYIEILNWIEWYSNTFEKIVGFKFHIHSMNPVGMANMKRIIERNGWELV